MRKRADDRDHASKRIFLVVAAVALILICWLFLVYQKSEHLDAVIGVVAGLLGGYGFGKASKAEG